MDRHTKQRINDIIVKFCRDKSTGFFVYLEPLQGDYVKPIFCSSVGESDVITILRTIVKAYDEDSKSFNPFSIN